MPVQALLPRLLCRRTLGVRHLQSPRFLGAPKILNVSENCILDNFLKPPQWKTIALLCFKVKNHSNPKETRKFVLWGPSFMFCLGPPIVLRPLWTSYDVTYFEYFSFKLTYLLLMFRLLLISLVFWSVLWQSNYSSSYCISTLLQLMYNIMEVLEMLNLWQKKLSKNKQECKLHQIAFFSSSVNCSLNYWNLTITVLMLYVW